MADPFEGLDSEDPFEGMDSSPFEGMDEGSAPSRSGPVDLYVDTQKSVFGAAEAVGSMVSGIPGALGGTLAGVSEAVQGRPFAPAFEHVSKAVNDVVQYKPTTEAGGKAIEAIAGFYEEVIQEPLKELGEWHQEKVNEVYAFSMTADDPLQKAMARQTAETGPIVSTALQFGPEVVTMFAPVKPIMKGIKGKKAKPQAEFVDLKTGKTVDPDVIPDRGRSLELLNSIREVNRKSTVNPHEGVGRQLARHAVFKPVELWRSWGSKELTDLADSISRPSRADRSTNYFGTDLIDHLSRSQAKYNKALDNMLQPYRGRFRAVQKEADVAIVRGLRTGKVRKEYREITTQVRDFLDTFIDNYVAPVLPDVGKVQNYFPQMWQVDKILRAPGAYKDFLKKLGFDDAAAENTMRRIIENEGSFEFGPDTSTRLLKGEDVSQWAGRIKQPGGPGKAANLDLSRKIDIPDELMVEAEKWLVNDLQGVMTNYIRNATRRVENARMFGAKEEILNAKVAAAIDELGIKDNPGAVEALTKDVYGLVDALAGKYKPIESVKVAKWNRRVANYETVAHLGLVSLASFPEMAAPAIQFGFVPTAYARGAAHAVLEATAAAERVLVGGARKTPKLKAAQALENLGAISLNSIQSTQASRFTSVTTNFTTKFMHATGLELLTDIQKVIAYDTLNTVLRRSAKAVAKGKSGKHKRLLEELGVKAEDAVKWVEEGMPETGPLGDLMENAKLRGQRWAITQPNAATKPLLFSDPHWTNVLLFKSFTSVFSNTFLKRAMSQLGLMKGKGETLGRRAGVIGGMAASVAIAYYTQYLREKINGRRIKQDELQRWVNAFDRAALSGPLTYAWTLVSPYRYGFTDSGSQRLFNLMGPVGGDLGKLFDAAFNTEISDKKRKELAIKAIPVVNITEASREAVLDVVD